MKYTKTGIELDDGTKISKEELLRNIALESSKDLAILTIEWKEERGFDGIKEQFIIKRDKYIEIRELLIGTTVYFGEINGKHSNIEGTIDNDEISLCIDNDTVVDFMINNPSSSLYNYSFINYINDNIDNYYTKEFSDKFKKIFGR